MPELLYNRSAAVAYAHRWAYSRNPNYYDFQLLGGDCTNFCSQCLYAGLGVMNDTPEVGWYYYSLNDRAPAWTATEFFYRFLTRGQHSPGPYGIETALADCLAGDFVQLCFHGFEYSHTLIVVSAGAAENNILLCAHSNDTDYTPLSSYSYKSVRYLHIAGGFSP